MVFEPKNKARKSPISEDVSLAKCDGIPEQNRRAHHMQKFQNEIGAHQRSSTIASAISVNAISGNILSSGPSGSSQSPIRIRLPAAM